MTGFNATKIALFKGKKIRKTLYNNEWWFSVVDVCEVLTDSVDARDYWFKMKIRVKEEDGFQPSTVCRQLKLLAPDGKMRETDCANVEGLFRIIQSIPSPKAEPLLGEKVTTEISDQEKPDTFSKNKIVAKRGGNVAGRARKETEKEIGRSVVTKNNYLTKPQNNKFLDK